MNDQLDAFIKGLDIQSIPIERQEKLNPLIDYIQSKYAEENLIQLNFICTHNSRRSQFSQIWAKIAAAYYDIPIESFSGGVEVTAFNTRVIDSLLNVGFGVDGIGEGNVNYTLHYSNDGAIKNLYSKLLDDEINPKSNFAAIMTCNDADKNCPFVLGCDVRISLPYNDPKQYDDCEREAEMYMERSIQIATEMMYVFSQIQK